MPSIAVTKKFAYLTANGGADGTVEIADTTNWHPGAKVNLRSDDTEAIQCVIVEHVGGNKLRLRPVTSTASYGGSGTLAAYTTAQNASLSMEPQVVAVQFPFTAKDRA